jgi:hypothetical protein
MSRSRFEVNSMNFGQRLSLSSGLEIERNIIEKYLNKRDSFLARNLIPATKKQCLDFSEGSILVGRRPYKGDTTTPLSCSDKNISNNLKKSLQGTYPLTRIALQATTQTFQTLLLEGKPSPIELALVYHSNPRELSAAKDVLADYVKYAYIVAGASHSIYGEVWDTGNDRLPLHTVRNYNEEKEYRKSFDASRLSEALEFRDIAQLILHLQSVNEYNEQKKAQSSNNNTDLVLYNANNSFFPKLSFFERWKYPHILSEKHAQWLKHQFTLKLRNIVDEESSNEIDDLRYLETDHSQRKKRLLNYVTLVLTTNLKDLYSGLEFIELLNAIMEFHGEAVSEKVRNNLLWQYASKPLQLTEKPKPNSYFFSFMNSQESNDHNIGARFSLPSTYAYLKSLEPYFNSALITSKLKGDKKSAEYFLECLFDRPQAEKKYRPTAHHTIEVYPEPCFIFLASLFIPYEELLSIALAHIEEDVENIFSAAYAQLTGQCYSTQITKVSEEDYKILGLNSTASEDEVKKAYRKLALEHHPDKNPDPGAMERFRQINTAYSHIMGSEKFKKAAEDSHTNTSKKNKEPSNEASKANLYDNPLNGSGPNIVIETSSSFDNDLITGSPISLPQQSEVKIEKAPQRPIHKQSQIEEPTITTGAIGTSAGPGADLGASVSLTDTGIYHAIIKSPIIDAGLIALGTGSLGLAIGAGIGSVVPGLGTVVGGIMGAGIGAAIPVVGALIAKAVQAYRNLKTSQSAPTKDSKGKEPAPDESLEAVGTHSGDLKHKDDQKESYRNEKAPPSPNGVPSQMGMYRSPESGTATEGRSPDNNLNLVSIRQ